MTGHWVRTCRAPKHFDDLYQTSLKGNSKRVETHATDNALAMTTVEVNTALVKGNPSTLIEAGSLELSDFFEDSDG